MPTTTTFEFGDVVLVPFPFAENRAITKQRPAIVISRADYSAEALVLGQAGLNLIVVIGVTSNEATLGAVSIHHWREAGLLHPSSIKPIITTLSHPEVIKKIGRLTASDGDALRRMLLKVLDLSPSSPTRHS